MPITKEFAIRQEDKPGTLGKLCRALADQNVNILAFQSFPSEKGKSSIHLVLDNHTAAKAVLDQQGANYTETEVAHIKLAHRPGELGRAASRLGDAGININYGYCGTDAVTNSSMLIFGVADAGKAAKALELAAGAAAAT
jgi:hypothetical protein